MSPRGNLMLSPEMARNRGSGLCQMLQLKEENVRFVLLAILLYIYLVAGALIFQAVEQTREREIRAHWNQLYEQFMNNLTFTSGSNSNSVASESDSVRSGGYSDHGYYEDLEHHDMKDEHHLENQNQQPDDGLTLISRSQLDQLLVAYGNAAKAGLTDLHTRDKWDYVGSFHFAWTIVSTIGYGATTPGTVMGKLLIIPYGFIGCAGGLLFFNLFLERIITFLACTMRYYRLQRQKRRSFIYRGSSQKEGHGQGQGPGEMSWGRRTSQSSADNASTAEDLEWKPSVYWVMLCLFIMSATVIFSAAGLFQHMEGWTYIESLYFCFVSYATIGFGDLVLLQKDTYSLNPYLETMYRVGAFAITVIGCCCIYSLLNVTSIVIKQLLNWIIKGMDCQCCFSWCQCSSASIRRRLSTKRQRSRRKRARSGKFKPERHQAGRGNANARSSFQIAVLKVCNLNHLNRNQNHGADTNGNSCGDSDNDRRFSGENMISIRGELSNKVSLAVMQKRLYESAMSQHSRPVSNDIDTRETFSATSVGPLAIVTEKLGDGSGSSGQHGHGHGHGHGH